MADGAFHLAAMDELVEVDCRILLVAGANEEARDAMDVSPLHRAATGRGIFASAKRFLSRKASSISATPTAPLALATSKGLRVRQLCASTLTATWSATTLRELQAHLGVGAPFLF